MYDIFDTYKTYADCHAIQMSSFYISLTLFFIRAEERKAEINRLNHLVEDKEKQLKEFNSNYERYFRRYMAEILSTRP